MIMFCEVLFVWRSAGFVVQVWNKLMSVQLEWCSKILVTRVLSRIRTPLQFSRRRFGWVGFRI